MKCSFNLHEDEYIQEAVGLLHSIGATWITSDNIHDYFLEVEFRKTPAILKTASNLEDSLNICRLSSIGLSFYLVDLIFGGETEKNLHFELNCADGVVFVPMGNIESISTVGNIVLNK